VANGVTKLSDKMEIVPITLERYNEKIKEHSKALGAGEMVEALSPKK
jgi:membrane fusion protein (multidrug efflux system)